MSEPDFLPDLFKLLKSQFSVVEMLSPYQKTKIAQSLVGKYENDPVKYAYEILKIKYLTPTQEKVLSLLAQPPYKVLVRSGHLTGKSYLAGIAVNWFFDTFDPSIVLTTAPTEMQVKDVLWKEIRVQRRNAGLGGFKGPLEPRLQTADNHFAQGYTARESSSFQGRHEENVMVVFDEAQAIAPDFWEAMETMVGGKRYAFLGIYNPIIQSSRVYKEEKETTKENSTFHPLVIMSSVDHPNIQKEIKGEPVLVPGAIRLKRLKEMLEKWSDKIPTRENSSSVFLDGQWYRPSSIAESRILGKWPTVPVDTVWSEALFTSCENLQLKDHGILQVGCDVARFGCFDKKTEILTSEGWKLFKNLNGNEKVLTWINGEAKWGPITKLHRYRFKGKLNLLHTERFSLCITDNHNMLWKRDYENKYSIGRFDSLPQNFTIPRFAYWQGKEILNKKFVSEIKMPNGGKRKRVWKFQGDDWCSFLGWFISEGNTYWAKRTNGGNKYGIIQISQVVSNEKIEEIGCLLTKMGLIWSRRGNQFEITNNKLAQWLDKHCGRGATNKRLPKEIKESTIKQINLFLDAYCKGDGTFTKGKRRAYHSSSKRLIGDIQELLVKLGSCGKLKRGAKKGSSFIIDGRTCIRTADSYILYERQSVKKKTSFIQKKKFRKIDYDDFVYCVSTPNKTIVTRRKGRVIWTGNSDFTSIIVRKGGVVLHHERHNGWRETLTAERLIEICHEWSDKYKPEVHYKKIPIAVDDTGVGGGLVDILHKKGFFVVGINAAWKVEMWEDEYPNLRSALWFGLVDMARKNQVSFSRLTKDSRDIIKEQLCTQKYELDQKARRVVWGKKKMKEEMEHSPDDADALNLSYIDIGPIIAEKSAGRVSVPQ